MELQHAGPAGLRHHAGRWRAAGSTPRHPGADGLAAAGAEVATRHAGVLASDAGDLAATTLPDGRQLITLAPAGQLLAGTTYTATLPAGVAPAKGALPLVQPVRWSFTTAPQPGLTARFPGEGRTCPRDQEIRLVFNTPMDRAAIQAALRLVPPATGLRVTTGDAEVRPRRT